MTPQLELAIIQRTYDLIKLYVPLLNKFPRDQKFMLGDRLQNTLYGVLEGLIRARYRRSKLDVLESLNAELDVVRYRKPQGLVAPRDGPRRVLPSAPGSNR